jgi:hypothetical protein
MHRHACPELTQLAAAAAERPWGPLPASQSECPHVVAPGWPVVQPWQAASLRCSMTVKQHEQAQLIGLRLGGRGGGSGGGAGGRGRLFGCSAVGPGPSDL